MSKPWGNIGAWAADSERAEAEEAEAQAAAAAVEPQSFPSLKEAVNSKPKKKKGTTITLSEFNRGGFDQGLTRDEMLTLPTGPKERSAEEMQFNRLGGGFSSYDRSGGRSRDRDGGNNEGSWGGGGRRSYGGFDEERRGPNPRVSELDQPSRADEVDNWASVKKSLPAYDSGRQNRYGGGGGGGFGGSSGGGGFGGSSGGGGFGVHGLLEAGKALGLNRRGRSLGLGLFGFGPLGIGGPGSDVAPGFGHFRDLEREARKWS